MNEPTMEQWLRAEYPDAPDAMIEVALRYERSARRPTATLSPASRNLLAPYLRRPAT